MAYELNVAAIAGNMTADPDIRYTSGDNPSSIARYTLAVNRRTGDADYVRCTVLGKQAEFTEKYLKKGSPVLVTGRIQTGSYTNKEGVRVNTLEIVADRQTTEKEGALNMNAVLLAGRLTRDPEVRYTQGETPVCIARYTLAVTRGYFSKRNGDKENADFVPCIAFGKSAEFVKSFLRKGTYIVVHGRIQTGSYINKEGNRVHLTEVLAEDHDFAERKNAGTAKAAPSKEEKENVQGSSPESTSAVTEQEGPCCSDPACAPDGFTDLPEDEDDILPFS